MRLGQLARKVSVRTTEIVGFLAARGVVVEDSVNTRIEDEHALSVIEKFAPHLLNVAETIAEPPVLITDDPELNPQPETTTEPEPPVDEETFVPLPSAEGAEAGEETVPEVIKAPKVELKGLTVVGKIELPELRKKEVPVTADEEKPVQPGKPERRDRDREQSKKPVRKSGKNPIALERERQAREEEERRQRKREEDKERRKSYYASRVKPSVPSRSVKLIDEPLSTLSEEGPEKPKGLLRRLLHWLTS